MQQINLKDEVQKVLAVEWQAFAQSHPHLAAAIDQAILVESAAQSIGDDPAYQKAMEDAVTANLATNMLSDLVGQFAKKWVQKLLGA